MKRPNARSAVVFLAAAATVIAGTACANEDMTEAGADTTDTTAATEPGHTTMGLDQFYSQTPEWTPCPENAAVECASVTVPLDYGDPMGQTLQLAVNRLGTTAADPATRIGSLLVNPGGPGVSGVDFVAAADQWAGEGLRTSYDIVGFDPRGVGRSNPITCMDDQLRDQYYATGLVASSEAEEVQVQEAADAYAQACASVSGDVLARIGTENVVADMDVLRGVLGDEKLNYFGISYGTLLGQYYAEQFPDRVGRMVLDSVMDPARSTSEIVVDNAASLDREYTAFMESCVQGECPLGPTVDDARAATETLVAQADAQPIPVPDQPDRPVNDADVLTALSASMTSVDTWPLLTQALKAALEGDGTGLRGLADEARGRNPETGVYDNSDLAHTAVVCLWTGDDERHPDAADTAIDDAIAESSIFGPLDLFRPCTSWPAAATLTPRPIEATGLPAILLMNNTGDPLTPLDWAEAAVGQLGDAVLLTNEGDGHGSFLKGECMFSALETYLLEGVLPENGASCQDNG